MPGITRPASLHVTPTKPDLQTDTRVVTDLVHAHALLAHGRGQTIMVAVAR